MRRIALITDLHGNLVATDAVLDDIRSGDIAETYCLGDLVGYGPDPTGVIDRVRSLGIPTVQGNYDRGVGGRLGECGCYYATEQARHDGEASYEFSVGAVGESDAAWLLARPTELRLEESGARVLLVHGSPRRQNEYLAADRSDAGLARLAAEAEADIVCVGHTHTQYHRRLAGEEGQPIHFVNAGSVGKPTDGDPRACWVEVLLGSEAEVSRAAPSDPAAGIAGATGLWCGTIAHRVAYDVDAVGAAMLAVGLPETLAKALLKG